MKKLSLVLIAVVVAGAAFAAPKAKTTIHCAVMPSNVVNIAKATAKHMYADVSGKRYFFCCGGCPEEFKASPAKFTKTAEFIKVPAAKKTTK